MSVLARTVVHLLLDVLKSLLHYVKEQYGAQHEHITAMWIFCNCHHLTLHNKLCHCKVES